jgi:hypothetical protein
MANQFKFCGTLTLLYLMISCEVLYSKGNYIEDFSSFVTDVKENCVNYSDEDWAKAEEKFTKYTVEEFGKFKQKLTDQEKEKISKLKGVYNLLKIEKAGKDFMDQTKDVINQVKGIIEEL